MKLVTFEEGQLQISDEALLVKPFRDLWRSDKSKTKEGFYNQMSYLYFMCDPRSSYNYVSSLKERSDLIVEQEQLPKNFVPSPQLKEAMIWYKKLVTTTSSLLLEDTRGAIDKVREFLKNFDLKEDVDDKGRPLYTISSITTALRQIPQLSKDLRDAEVALSKELDEVTRAKGGNENKTLFEDGFSNI